MFQAHFSKIIWGTCLLLVINSGDGLNFEVREGILNSTYNLNINSKSQHIFEFKLENSFKFSFHLETTVDENASTSCALLFTARQSTSALSWNLPQSIGSEGNTKKRIFKANRTLCMETNQEETSKIVIVEVSTCSNQTTGYTLTALERKDVQLSLNKPYNIQASVSSPTFYRYTFTKTSPDIILIHVTSENIDCTLVSVQSPQCPVMNKQVNLRFDGFWQTMTLQSGITVQRSEFPDGFFISFSVLHDDTLCAQDFGQIRATARNVSRDSLKILNLMARADLRESDYIFALLFPLILYAALIIVTFTIYFVFHRLRCKMDDEIREGFGSDEESITEIKDKTLIPNIAPLYICEIRKLGDEDLLKKSKRYYLSMIVIVIFYLVPVFQLITHYMEVMKSTGENDLCFYNGFCSHPLHKFKDFNHIYSNIGYIILGTYFLILVWIREKSCVSDEKLLPPLENNENSKSRRPRWQLLWPIFPKTLKKNDHGTISVTGNYVAMALALILEGNGSIIYHICPNQSNFQFDVAFMYLIAVLNIIKVYNLRHPVYISATLLFTCLGMVACTAVFGLMFQSDTFLLCFSIVYGFFVFLILFYQYHVGYIRVNGEIVTSLVGVYKALFLFSFGWLKKRFNKAIRIETNDDYEICFSSARLKMILPLFGGIFNGFLILGVWTVLQKQNFATQVLTIFVVNSVGYIIYYAVMKIIHKEGRNILAVQPLIYAVLSLVFWLTGLYYFTIVLTSWETSAAESRVKNSPCILLGFFDAHDIWHMFSCVGMLCSFMILLTIDDDMVHVPQRKIPVF